MARGALRCDIETALSDDQVVSIFKETLGRRHWAKQLVGSPSLWKLVTPPSDARAAAEWVRNRREERIHAIKPGGFQDSAISGQIGTVIALGFNGAESGRTGAHLFTSVLTKLANGKVNPVGAVTIRHQMKRVASAVTKQDPSAQVSHYEDNE